MNDIINTSNQTPIEIALGIDENGYTTARALYDFLEMPSQNFARWAKRTLKKMNTLKKIRIGGGSSR